MSIAQINGIKDLFGYKLKKTQHALRIKMDENLKVLGLTTPQYAVLAQLELNPGISNASLARAAFITPQSMHGIVSNLEKRSLVHRESNPSHGRILCTKLTKNGHKALTKAHEIISKTESIMLATINKEEKELFEKLLLACLNNLLTK